MNNKIDVFIPTYNRKDNAKTHLLFADCLDKYKITYLFHTKEEAEAYKLPEWCIKHVSGVKTGITGCCLQKRYAHRIATSEYFCILDDNIDSIYSKAGKVCISEAISDTIKGMSLHNCYLGGISPSTNLFFLGDKYRFYGKIIGKFNVFKKGTLTTDPLVAEDISEDVIITASYIRTYGKCLVNSKYCGKWIHYEKGGMGSRTHRENSGLLRELIDIVKEYYPIVRFAKKFGEVEFCPKKEGYRDLIEHDWVVAVKHLYGIK